MKRNLLFVVALVAMCLQVVAQDALPTAASIDIKKTSSDITVDGFNDEAVWGGAEELTFDYTYQDAMIAETDMSATVQLAWKEGLGVYMFLSITDDMESYWESGDTYQRDNAEIFFYWGKEADADWGPTTAVTAVDNDTLYNQLRIQLNSAYETIHDGRYQGSWGGHTLGAASEGNLEAVATTSSSGWDIEAIFPFAMFAKKEEITDELSFGFDISLGDADEADRDFQLSLMNDSKQDLAWTNKAYLNTAVLSATKVTGVEETSVSSVSVYPTLVSDVLNLKGEVSSLAIYNTVGQVVLSVEDVNSTTIDVSGLQSGIYFVDLDGQTTKIIKN